MRSLLLTVLLVFQACVVHAIHKSDVGIVDWYKKLVGAPLTGSVSTAPAFRRHGGKEVILTATTSNVMAALSPVDGHVEWRHIFEAEDRIAGYYVHDNVVATLSGPGGAMLRTFDINTGVQLLEKQLHRPELGTIAEPHFLGKHVVFGGNNSTDLYALTNGHTVVRMDQSTGEVLWRFDMPDASSLVIHPKIVLSPSALYLVGFAKSTQSYTLHVTSLAPETGEFITTANIPSSIGDPMADFLVLSNGVSENNRLVWLERGSFMHVPLVPELNAKPATVKNAEFESLLDIGLANHGYTIAVKKDGTGRIIKLVDNGLKSVYEFKDLASGGEHPPQPVYAGNVDETGHVHVARVYWAAKVNGIALETYSGAQDITIRYFRFDTTNNGIVSFAALNIKGANSEEIVPQVLVSTYTGNIQLLENAETKWNRDEALTTAVVSEFAELPPPKAVVGDHEDESFVGRVLRHIGDLQGSRIFLKHNILLFCIQNLPAYTIHFIERFFRNQSPVTSHQVKFDPNDPVRDEFGFRQIIVVATMFGKVYGIDSATGEVVWTRLLGLGWAAQVGGRLIPVKMFVFNGEGVGDKGKGTRSDVVLVVQRRADNTLIDTVVFHIDAATGEDATGQVARKDVLEGTDVVAGAIVESYLLQHENQKLVVFFDEFLQAYTYPDTEEARKVLEELAPSFYFTLRSSIDAAAVQQGRPIQRRLIGHQVAKNEESSRHRLVAHPVWTLNLPENEDIVGLVSPNQGPVASFGKVLANRTTLYKYLNSHMSVVLTGQHAAPSMPPSDGAATAPQGNTGHQGCGVYVVDAVKGAVLYRASLPAPGPGMKCNVKATLTENWLVYHYYDPEEDAVEGARGWRMVSAEFYEGGIDEKSKSSETSSYSDSAANAQVFEDTFVFTQAISAITTTKTKFGISLKDVIVATRSNKIQSYPKRLLDPRRPRHKPTNQEVEEGLIQYEPVLPDNPKFVLSHEYDIVNTQRIITAPSLLESTSLVFASGLDMFLTRTSPSGTFDLLSETFNKKQLIWTVGGLLVAILVVRPMVREKRLNGKWFF